MAEHLGTTAPPDGLGRGGAPRPDETALLLCTVATHRFGLLVSDVLEVHRAVAVTPLPAAPEPIIGIVDVRGSFVPVLDLRRRLGLPPRDVTPSDLLIQVEVRDRQLLLLVDEASRVERVPATSLEDAEPLVPGARFLGAIGRSPSGPLVIHDLATFLSSSELSGLDRALHQHQRHRDPAPSR